MQAVVCEKCGATKISVEKGCMICEYCGTKFVNAEINQKLNVKKESHIGIANDIARLIQKCEEDPLNARRYANRVLDMDPGNKDVLKYL